jgi:hypothetical protein
MALELDETAIPVRRERTQGCGREPDLVESEFAGARTDLLARIGRRPAQKSRSS